MRGTMRVWGALAALILVFVPAIARAAVGNCTIVPSGIVFGTFTGSEVDVTGTIRVSCTGGSGNNSVSVKINAGTPPSTFANRVLLGFGGQLNYQLYTDSTRAHVFGDNTGGTSAPLIAITYVSGVAAPATVSFFAVLKAQALPPSGTYASVITVTLDPGGTSGSGSFAVTANVVPGCSVTASNLGFGNYNLVQLDATTTLSATCTSGTSYNLGLDQGGSTGATVTTRRMKGPGVDFLSYGLFQNSGRTTNWGNTVGTDTVASTGTGSAQSFTIFGRIPASQTPPPGSFQDMITVTLTF